MTYAPTEYRPFRRVLVGWDSSPDAAVALRTAVAIADKQDGRVVALTVLRPAPHTEEDEDDEIPAGQLRLRDRALVTFTNAKHALGESPGPSVTLEFTESSHAADAICEYARLHCYDLLVIGRHGTGGLLHPKLGHVARGAARNGQVSVLLAAENV